MDRQTARELKLLRNQSVTGQMIRDYRTLAVISRKAKMLQKRAKRQRRREELESWEYQD